MTTAAELIDARALRTVGHKVATPKRPRPGDDRDDRDRDDRDDRVLRKSGPSQSERIVQLAISLYELGVTTEGEPFAVERGGPNVARMFRGNRDSLRSLLAREYRRAEGKTPTAASLADALTVLEGEAADATPEKVALRVAQHEDDVVVDLGDLSGRVVIVSAAGWRVADVSPVLFRRTALTGPLPVPKRGGSLGELRDLLNVTTESWTPIVGWLIASLIPDIPHPILFPGGEQGAGKSTAAKMIAALVDPSPAPLRSEPRDAESWAVAASGSWVVALDNVSSIPAWLSDALCKAVTGDGWIRRRLYSDSELSVLHFRRCLIITSIDAGVLRGDLADRLLLVDLQHIPPERRRTEADLAAIFDDRRPFIFGALLDVLGSVLAELPNVELRELPRMADFARVLAALDRAQSALTNKAALQTYLDQGSRLADDVIEGDAFAGALVRLVDDAGSWSGTPGELLARLAPDHPPRGWPATARAASGRLRRLVPALRVLGWQVDIPSVRTRRGRIITIARTEEGMTPADVPPFAVAGADDRESELL